MPRNLVSVEFCSDIDARRDFERFDVRELLRSFSPRLTSIKGTTVFPLVQDYHPIRWSRD
jgi:hypothetical protein